MRHRVLSAAVLAWFCAGPCLASPWAEIGDGALRSDIEILAAAGVIPDLTSQWPLPWTSISHVLSAASLSDQPDWVRDAAQRVMEAAHRQTQDGMHAAVLADLTNRTSVVHDFDSLGRGQGQTQFALDYNAQSFSGRLALGAFTSDFSGARVIADESFVAAKLGGALVYAGALSHWWGPGWISALSLSNNAPPIPQIGIERLDSTAFSWPVLDWLGPWQAEFFLGLLDGPRIDKHTLFSALRVTVNPAPGLQIGLARTQEFCGEHHVCNPLRGYFDLRNDAGHTDITNDQGLIDVAYTTEVAGLPVSAYLQLMNEDSSPFTHSGTSHLFGASLWRMLAGNMVRFSLEYSDSVATTDIFSFGNVMPGFAYSNFTYLDGMRYRGRTLGFSLDSDSRLASLQMAWNDPQGRFYQISLHHAAISDAANHLGNAVTTLPVALNMGELRLTLPLPGFRLDLAGRIQDDQPRPRRGVGVSVEAAIRYEL